MVSFIASLQEYGPARGVRSAVAGAAFILLARLRGVPSPRPAEIGRALVVGCLLFVGGHSLLAWAELRISTGQTAILIATMPLWVPALRWMVDSRRRPSRRSGAGLLIGFAGVAFLLAPSLMPQEGGPSGGPSGGIDLLGSVAALISVLFWALGSVVSSDRPSARSPVMVAGLQLLTGGMAAILLGGVLDEWSSLSLGAVSVESLLALGYLILFGALLTFGAYTWLLQVCSAEKVATYAYVNPVVALLLGALFYAEPIGLRELVATAVILAAVALVMITPRDPGRRIL